MKRSFRNLERALHMGPFLFGVRLVETVIGLAVRLVQRAVRKEKGG